MLVIMCLVLLGWFVTYKVAFSIRDAGRMMRQSKRRNVNKDIAKLKANVELKKLGSKLSLNVNSAGPSVAMLRKARNLNLGFRELTVDISNGKTTQRIIDNVSGDIRAGRLTAIMGPSGAGKSSFLHVIGGRLRAVGQGQSHVNISGSVLINGERRSMHSYRRVIGFVPQDDILHENLTPKDSFRLVSGLRLPSHYSYKQRKELVNNVLQLLDLNKIRHSRIGNSKQRGISGGQRKRVNIGIELVADPWMLFLDEPTSGLDSAGAHKVVSILRKLADLGLTVVCVLHQPRVSIFNMLDDVILLGLGGKLVYSGPRRKATTYFRTMGFELPVGNLNPADWLTDVVAGEVNNTTHKHLGTAKELQLLWLATRSVRLQRISGASSFTEDSENGVVDEVEKKLLSDGMVITKHPRWGKPESRQFYLKKENGSMKLVWTSTKGAKGGSIVGDWLGLAGTIVENLEDIVEIREGLTTKILERTGVPARSHLYFSIILKSRTLDLESATEEERDDLVLCLNHHLRAAKRSADGKGDTPKSGRYAQSRLPPHTPQNPVFHKGDEDEEKDDDDEDFVDDVEKGGNGQNPVRNGKQKRLETVASESELTKLADLMEGYGSDSDDEGMKTIQSRSWNEDDDDEEEEDYNEFAKTTNRGGRRNSSMKPPPMVNTQFSSIISEGSDKSPKLASKKASSGASTPSRTRRSSSISPRQVVKRVSTVGQKIKQHLGRRFSTANKKKKENLLDPLSRQNPTIGWQIKHYLKISFLVQSAWATIVDISMISAAGLALGIVYTNVEESDNEIYSFAMASLSMGILASTSVERYFPSDLPVLIRETSSGTSVRAYFIGKNLSHLLLILTMPMFFCVFYVAFAAPRLNSFELYLGLLGITWACTGAGYALSMTFNSKAQLACTIYPLVCTMFAGVNPTLLELKESVIGWVLSTVSYARWSTNYLWINQADCYDEFLFPSVQAKTEDQGYETGGGSCGLALFLIGLIFRAICFFQIRAIKKANAHGGGEGVHFFWE
ncbi:hypothetical protein TL16_g02370 [Triparma laevis f. inornata]|uniref:ABC transporter domain-containing protein n=1 Tax=Triparma laevis f. inornata TaxID=1714386 RepID=A0A9W6ZU55_9STRA|nr:hypothetical protein TL16_g02370 [Triparma laevis f. inornata]